MRSNLLKFICLSIFILISGFVFSQTNQTDELGRKQGRWVKYQDQIKVYEGVFVDNRPVGEFLRFFPSGNLSSKSNFIEDSDSVFTEFYFDSPQKIVKAEGLYMNKEKDGTWNYYNETGVLIKQEHFNLGVSNGLWKLFNYKGNLMKETPYLNGVLHGAQKEYYDNGNLRRLISFEQDMVNGEYQLYFEDGVKRLDGQFTYGTQDKDWYFYNETGALEYVEYYLQDSLISRLDSQGKPYELQKDADTVDLEVTPEEVMELRY